jgi:thymidylate synthase
MSKYPLIMTTGPTAIDPDAGIIMPFKGYGGAQVKMDASNVRNGDPYHAEYQYLMLLSELLAKHKDNPTPREDRTGTGTFSVFGRQIRFDLADGFPLLTTKKVFWKGVVAELLWMLSGSTNAKELQEQNVHIWDEWCDENCNLGPVYGKQWRSWEGHEGHIDQISLVLKNLREKPHDRGHVVSAWNPADLDRMHLRPCHALFQFYVEDGKLSCQLYQRSADIFLGVPFNIASYALLTHLMANELGLGVGDFVHTFGDLHLYSNHVEQAIEQLGRSPRPFPKLILRAGDSLFDTTLDNIQLSGYDPHPAIKAEVSV